MSCGYKIGKLKNFVYLVKDLVYNVSDYKVYITKGEVYKLNADLVTLNETEDFSGRFRFKTQVVCRLNRIFDDTILRENKFKIVVEDLKGMLFLVSPEFTAKYTSEYNIADTINYELYFNTESNIPTRIIRSKITAEEKLPICQYNRQTIESLFIGLNNNYLKVDYMSASYNKTFNGLQNDELVTFTIPIEDNDWHYDLIKFPNNRWDVKLKLGEDEIIIDNAFPKYVRQTSESGVDKFTITFKSVNSGTQLGITILEKIYRWITTSEYICDGFNQYTKEIKLVYNLGIWENTEEFRKGILVLRNSETCGYSTDTIYKWEVQAITIAYECVGNDKHYQEKQYKSTNGGITWVDTGVTRAGVLYMAESLDCGYVHEEWLPVEGEFYCDEFDPSVTWVLTDEFYCKPVNI